MKTMVVISLAVLLALPCAAQTASELLQKGIFAQETQGNLDTAIELFRQAFNAAGTQRDIAAQAQFRLAQALLRKGDTANAALEMDKLAREFPDQRELIARMAGSRAPMAIGATPPTAKQYDESRLVTVQGTVTQLLWMNPTAWMKITDGSGAEWSVSTTSPNQLLKQNWTRDTLTPGASVTVTAYPALDGSKTAAAATVIRQSDGVKLFDRTAPQSQPAQAASDAVHEKK